MRVYIHDLDTDSTIVVNSETECNTGHELSLYRAVKQHDSAIAMGNTIAYPERFAKKPYQRGDIKYDTTRTKEKV